MNAGQPVTWRLLLERRFDSTALLGRHRAASVEVTSAREIDRARYLPMQEKFGSLLPGIGIQNRGKEGPGIRVQRLLE